MKRNAEDRPVLVTGGTGFIGGYVSRKLISLGRRVVAFSRGTVSPEMHSVLGEYSDRLVVERGVVEDFPRLIEVVKAHSPSAVVHLAHNVDVLQLMRNPYQAFSIDLQGTLNVLETARLFGVERVVYFSSIGVLPARCYEPIDAAHPLVLPRKGPATGAYGAAKASSEMFAFAYEQAFGLDVRIIRPSAVYGFGMPWHSPNYMKQFVEPAVRGEEVRLSSGGLLPRDYTHVLDVADLTAKVLDAPDDADRIFYAATGQPLITAGQVTKLVMELVPGSTIEIADTLTPDDQMEASFRGVISIANATEQLGWKPVYASVREGIGEYVSRYRAFLAAAAVGES
jgi:nucleoside-diphosphate-sugar epimerase